MRSSFPEQWWTVSTCCAHVLYVSAQQETALDWTPLIIGKRWHSHFPFLLALFLFFFFSMEAEISNEVERKMILPAAFRRRELFYLRSVVVSIGSANRRGRSHGAGFAAAFTALWLPWLLDPENEREKTHLRETVLMCIEFPLHGS